MSSMSRPTIFLLLLASAALAAQQSASQPTTAATGPNPDTSYIDAQGTVHVTRVVPVPKTISAEAQRVLAHPVLILPGIPDIPDQGSPAPMSLDQSRGIVDAYAARTAEAWRKICAVDIVEDRIAGVPVRIVRPKGLTEANRDKVLLNLHGGGFEFEGGSLAESIPIASYAKIKVVTVLYRLAPEYPFPAAVDDAISVYKELLKTYRPEHIAIYGTSAGATLTAEVAAKLKQLGLPLPGALGIFSGSGDFARTGDSEALFGLRGLSGHLDPPESSPDDSDYTARTDLKDPVLSPVYSDLRGIPPTLFVTSERDMLLSGTVNLHRAYLSAGVDARLVVFDALTHGFWYDAQLPEAREASHIMADFFVKQLGK